MSVEGVEWMHQLGPTHWEKTKERLGRLGSWAVGREQGAEIYEYIRSL